jgi:hypothetical protein
LSGSSIRALLLASALILARPSSASGMTDPDDIIRSRQNEMAFHLGLGSAIGYVGVTYAHEPLPFFQFEVGAGLGFSGVQFSAMPKYVACDGSHCFISGAGLSLAVPTSAAATGHPTWLNIDALGYGYRSISGASFDIAVGVGAGLGGGRACTGFVDCGDPVPNVRGQWFFQTRIGVGYWY